MHDRADLKISSRMLRDELLAIGRLVRDHIVKNRALDDSFVDRVEGGDTIFRIDRRVEPIVLSSIASWSQDILPIVLICEGLGENGLKKFGNSSLPSRYRVMIDPIDGTRSLMYDKRSAWFLATVAEDRGADTIVSQSIASVAVELPTSKQSRSDEIAFCLGDGVIGKRVDLISQADENLHIQPSRAPSLENGFGQVANFFPGTKVLASELMEAIAASVVGQVQVGQASIFEDQYICTGGQMMELAMGRDRLCCDLRPIFYDIIERRTGSSIARGLECHPYDIGAMKIAKEVGVILTDGFGRPLDAPFDVGSAVHWCGYANESIRDKVEPAIQAWIGGHLKT